MQQRKERALEVCKFALRLPSDVIQNIRTLFTEGTNVIMDCIYD